MATKSNKKSVKLTVEQAELRAARRDNIRWITGFVIISMGIFVLSSIVSFLFYWREDMDAIYQSINPTYRAIYNNVCGHLGAVVSMRLVGNGFGLFAAVVPLVLLVLGWRLFRNKPLRLWYTAISSGLVIILGSLSLAFIFDTRWELYGSGLGGAYGLAMNDYLQGLMGIGTLLVILAGWILTGLFINRNFLQRVDSAGEQVAGGITGAASWMMERLKRDNGAVQEANEDEVVDSHAETNARVAPETPQTASPFTSVPLTAQQQTQLCAEQEVQTERDKQPAGPFVVVSTDAQVKLDDNGNLVVEGEAQPKVVVDDYPFKDPEAPIEEPLSDEQMAFLKAQQGQAAATVAAASSGPFTTVPREVVDPHSATSPHTAIDPQPITGPQSTAEAEPSTDEGLVITVEQPRAKTISPESIHNDLYDPMRDLFDYVPPKPTLLTDHKSVAVANDDEIFQNKERIRETLLNFGIPIRSMHATVGPTVTLYEIVQEQGVKISKIQGLENDIAQSLKALGIRIIAPIPGRGTIGIEVPNLTKQTVSMYSAICSREFQESKAQLPIVIGRTIQNENYTFDLAKMPHLLVAGATGQGKSVGLNAIITSLLYRKHPAELKFVLIDPKMVEFSPFSKIEKHFLAKMESEDEAIITDPRKAVYTLNSLCVEMENRLELCKQAHTRNIVEYNEKFTKRQLNPENGHRFLPYIVVIIDEFADLIMTAKEVEAPVMRLAQKARAVGIHLIVATQRPDVRVITGGIKANFPARIAFRVMQMTDSRTIIDQPGANQLIGRGDMLLSNGGELTRIQCAFVDTPEVERIVDHIGRQQGYTSAYALPDYTPEQGGGDAMPNFGSEESSAPQKYDPKFGEIARDAVANGMISTSMIQRNYEVGFNRAGRIMLQLERAGIVGPQIGSKPREIKFYDLNSLEARLQELGVS